jgi:hypothetical protein
MEKKVKKAMQDSVKESDKEELNRLRSRLLQLIREIKAQHSETDLSNGKTVI